MSTSQFRLNCMTFPKKSQETSRRITESKRFRRSIHQSITKRLLEIVRSDQLHILSITLMQKFTRSSKLSSVYPVTLMFPVIPHGLRVVRTFTKLGFSVEKLVGSAWQFKPHADSLYHHKIQFHQPHPDGEVDLRLARRYGRRLTRAYGWYGDLFKLK
jgi:hypothetical protein